MRSTPNSHKEQTPMSSDQIERAKGLAYGAGVALSCMGWGASPAAERKMIAEARDKLRQADRILAGLKP